MGSQTENIRLCVAKLRHLEGAMPATVEKAKRAESAVKAIKAKAIGRILSDEERSEVDAWQGALDAPAVLQGHIDELRGDLKTAAAIIDKAV